MIHCTNCQYEGEPKLKSAGCLLWLAAGILLVVSIFFWPLFFISIPFPIYLLARKPQEVCPKCGWIYISPVQLKQQ